MSLRLRLLAAFTYVLVLVLVALEIPLVFSLSSRVDAEVRAQASAQAQIVAAQAAARLGNASQLLRVARSASRDLGGRVIVVNARGRLLADSAGAGLGSRSYRSRPEIREALAGKTAQGTRRSDTLGEDLLYTAVPVLDEGKRVGAVRVTQSVEAVTQRVRRNVLVLVGVGLIALALGLALAWVLAGSLSRPLRALARTARRVESGELDARAEVSGATEQQEVALAFNDMTERLAQVLAAQRDFVANASHQLRTPLTGLRLRLEAIKGEGGLAGEQAAKAELELDRLSTLVHDLLALARATAIESTASPVDLGALAREAVGRWREGAAASGKRVELEELGNPHVWANREDLAHVLDNLIDNALRYSPPGTEVRVETDERGGNAYLAVVDTGPGIPPEDRARVFERFYRGASGRQAGRGTGLGLAIVEEHVRRWGGEIRLADAPGTRVETVFLRLPTER